MLKRVRGYFFTGLLVLFPVLGTAGVIYWLFIFITNFLVKPLSHYIPSDKQIFVRSASLIVAFILVVFIGFLAKMVFVRKISKPFENLLIRIPLINKIYKTFKQISLALWESQATILRQVVLIEYPRKGIWSVGFTTSCVKSRASEILKGDYIGLFVPTTPNPTSGLFIIVARKDVIFTSISIEDGLKLVVSAGTIEPYEMKKIG
ncbi:DUF502 domain-containing protein [bacterium]|jgi:uncharacterized membrane protein|nr:DUF502 domain-containing protein [bacterium]